MNQKPKSDVIIPRLLRIQDVARYMNATTWFVEELIRNKKIHFLVMGKRRVVDIHDLDDWIEEQKKPQPQVLTDEEAQALFDGCEQDEDGNYVVRVFGKEE